jgi:tetratricopeptide (TPR) repeat protein
MAPNRALSRESTKAARKKVDGRGKTAPKRVALATIQEPAWFVRYAIVTVIALIVWVAFSPVLQNGFVNWDDDANLLENPNYRGLGWRQLSWMFTTFFGGHYQPLTWMTFGMDYLLWGMQPFGYHLTNLILHVANAQLCYFLAVRLFTLAYPGAAEITGLRIRLAGAIAALLFAAHPLRVESVAWATERRDVLSGFFIFLTMLFYLRANSHPGNPARTRWMWAAVVVYGLSLLSKAIGMTIPFVLLVLDVYPLRRLSGATRKWFGPDAPKILLEKIPFLILAVAAAAVAPMAQGGVMRSMHDHGTFERLAQALFGLAFYLWKTVLPVELAPLYELPEKFSPVEWPFLLSGLIVLAVSIGVFICRQRWPALLASWVCYAVLLAPVLGFAQSGPQVAADRYSYLACVGWAVVAGAASLSLLRSRLAGKAWASPLVLGIGLASIAILGSLTWRQSRIWHDSITLWRHGLAVAEGSLFKSSIAHSNLGVALYGRGELAEAIRHYREALRVDPGFAQAHNNLGKALADRGELALAMTHYREALRIDPRYAEAHNNLGNALADGGELAPATIHYREAIRIKPTDADAYLNLANVLVKQDQVGAAIKLFRESVRLDPSNARAHYNLGTVLAKSGELEEATQQFNETLKIEPAHAMAHFNLGFALAMRGDLESAIEHFQHALQGDPMNAMAHEALARTFALQGRQDEATRHFQEAQRIMKARSEKSRPG